MATTDDLVETARRLGFTECTCHVCEQSKDPRCWNCEGAGTVWRDGAMTLSRSGLERFVRLMKPGDPRK